MIAPRRFLPSISALRALEALDRLGSATAVASELNLTQSAVSRQLQSIEQQLGVPLVDRHAKHLRLTPAAADYADQIRQPLNQIASAALKLQVQPEGGSLRLAILPTFGMRWLVPRLADFAKRHPEVTINMSTRLAPFNFASEPFDAALHFGDADWSGTHNIRLKPERVVPVCAPELLERQTVATPQDILKLPLLHIETRPNAWSQWLATYGLTLEARRGSLYDQFSTITQAALHGLGVALLPDYLVEQDLATGRLVMAYGGPTQSLGAYYLVWPKDRGNDPALRVFLDWLAGQAEDEDALPR